MRLKDLSTREKALLMAGIFCLILLGGIVFLGVQFNKISLEGYKCLSSPKGYLEQGLSISEGEPYSCSCSPSSSNLALNLQPVS